ncbi:MAG: TolB family protein, partial [Anaerolineae bacterium]
PTFWSPDGSLIAFSSDRDPSYQDERVFLMDATGGNVRAVTPVGPGRADRNPDWSPDGSRIVFSSLYDRTNWEVCIIGVDGGGLTRLTDNPEWDGEASWSPR